MHKNGGHIEDYFLQVSKLIIDTNDTHNMENIVLMHFDISENVGSKLEI